MNILDDLFRVITIFVTFVILIFTMIFIKKILLLSTSSYQELKLEHELGEVHMFRKDQNHILASSGNGYLPP